MLAMKKCFWCGKYFFPWKIRRNSFGLGIYFDTRDKCAKCGEYIPNTDDVELFSKVHERWKKLSKDFDYSDENVRKISVLNDILRGKMEELFDKAVEISELFVRLQEDGHEDFYEFTIEGKLSLFGPDLGNAGENLSENGESAPEGSNDSPCIPEWKLDDEMRELIDYLYNFSNSAVPQVVLKLDYNTATYWASSFYWKKFITDAPHKGVFAHPALDGIKLCPAMDVFFNQQKIFSLQDALFMDENDFKITFSITTAKHLWKPDPKFKKFDDFDLYTSTNSHYFKKGKRSDRFYWSYGKMGKIVEYLKKRNDTFDWTYDNKMKVFEIADRTTELLNYMYDEAFRLKKIFVDEYASGKAQYRSFAIDGWLKYHNRSAYPDTNRRMARLLCETVNSGAILHHVRCICNDSADTENERSEQVFIAPANDEHYNWNIENFDKGWVGNHPINYFMHSLFVDSCIYTMNDILYMNPADWQPQFEIHLSER